MDTNDDSSIDILDSVSSKRTGCVINPFYVQRDMQTYPITENELLNLTNYKRDTIVFSSVASGFISISLTLIVSALFIKWDSIPEYGKAVLILGIPTSVILTGVFYFLAYRKNKTERDTIQLIKSECVKSTKQPASPTD